MKTAVLLLQGVLIIALMAACTTESSRKMARSHLDLGTAYLESGSYTSALKEFLEAEKLTPRDPETHFHLGVAYYEAGLMEKAARKFQKAVKYKPGYSVAHNYLGTVYMRTGRYDEAIQEFTATLSDDLYGTPVLALNNLGWAYYKKGNYTMALVKYREALKRAPNTNILFLIQKNMGIAYFAENKIDKAISYLETSLETAPYIPESHYWLAMSYLKNGKYTNALSEFRETVKLNPTSEYGRKAKKQIDTLLEQ